MHPLDRVRQVASYALAGLLVLNAAFCFAMLALSVSRTLGGDPAYGADEVMAFAGLTAAFAGAAWFFWWFGRAAGR